MNERIGHIMQIRGSFKSESTHNLLDTSVVESTGGSVFMDPIKRGHVAKLLKSRLVMKQKVYHAVLDKVLNLPHLQGSREFDHLPFII